MLQNLLVEQVCAQFTLWWQGSQTLQTLGEAAGVPAAVPQRQREGGCSLAGHRVQCPAQGVIPLDREVSCLVIWSHRGGQLASVSGEVHSPVCGVTLLLWFGNQSWGPLCGKFGRRSGFTVNNEH